MIRKLHIEGFKSVASETIELGRINCFIGANGTGKSNLLEALGVLGAAAKGVVDDESLMRRGVRPGLPRLYKASFDSKRTPAHIMMEANGSQGELYRVSLLNPRLIMNLTARLADWLKYNSPDRQLLFTAHNPAVLDGLELSDSEVRLFAVDRNSDGITCVRRIELTQELLAMNRDYPLSRLWLMGHLGAVPNV